MRWGKKKKKKWKGGKKKAPRAVPARPLLAPTAGNAGTMASCAQERNHSHLPSSPHATRAPAAARTPAGLCLSVREKREMAMDRKKMEKKKKRRE